MIYYIVNNKIIGYEQEFDTSLYNYPKLTEEQAAFYEQYKCSLQEAIDMKLVVPYEPTFEELKADKIREVKSYTAEELTKTDYKITRQKEQKELGIETTLSEGYYIQLIEERQRLRNWSNEIEEAINNCATIEELNELESL